MMSMKERAAIIKVLNRYTINGKVSLVYGLYKNKKIYRDEIKREMKK